MKPQHYNHSIKLSRWHPFNYTFASILSQLLNLNYASSCYPYQFSYHRYQHDSTRTSINFAPGQLQIQPDWPHFAYYSHHLSNSMTCCQSQIIPTESSIKSIQQNLENGDSAVRPSATLWKVVTSTIEATAALCWIIGKLSKSCYEQLAMRSFNIILYYFQLVSGKESCLI